MANYVIGEVVILSCEVRDSAGTLVDPATSMKVKIDSVVAETAMTKDSVGKYHYDWATTTNNKGAYTVEYIATDGTRISKKRSTIDLS